jgi:hypothetical protein
MRVSRGPCTRARGPCTSSAFGRRLGLQLGTASRVVGDSCRHGRLSAGRAARYESLVLLLPLVAAPPPSPQTPRPAVASEGQSRALRGGWGGPLLRSSCSSCTQDRHRSHCLRRHSGYRAPSVPLPCIHRVRMQSSQGRAGQGGAGMTAACTAVRRM